MPKFTSFPTEVQSALKYYVYRLIDPRNGETFYVGKGRGNRVFSHAAGDLGRCDESGDDTSGTKLERVRRIRLAGLEVQHVIHRHGMDSRTAFEVEGALIDAYPGLTNVAGGHGGADRGSLHADEIIREFVADEIDFTITTTKAIEITINRSAAMGDAYDAARYAWRLDVNRAQKCDLVLAVTNGLIVEVLKPEQWLPATFENFPEFQNSGPEHPDRYGFRGRVADTATREQFIGMKTPARARGAANPIRYFNC